MSPYIIIFLLSIGAIVQSLDVAKMKKNIDELEYRISQLEGK